MATISLTGVSHLLKNSHPIPPCFQYFPAFGQRNIFKKIYK